MANKRGIKVVEGIPFVKKKTIKKPSKCPVCGAPGGEYQCDDCGWAVEDIEDSDSIMMDPLTTIMRAKESYIQARRENMDLKRKVEALIVNNQKMTELIEALTGQVQTMQFRDGKTKSKFTYKYEDGGWEEVTETDRSKFQMKKQNVNVQDINDQLTQIIKLLNNHKKSKSGK